jgi:hypothetical protein
LLSIFAATFLLALTNNGMTINEPIAKAMPGRLSSGLLLSTMKRLSHN